MLVKILTDRSIRKVEEKIGYPRAIMINSGSICSIEFFGKKGLLRGFGKSRQEALKQALKGVV